MKENKPPCPKKEYQKVSFELKLMIIDQIQNGQISVNYAAKSYNVSRSSIDYWLKKYSTLEQKKRGMSKQDEIKKLKEKIEELEFIKEFQRDYIANLENLSGLDLAKKHLPEALAKEIEKRKRDLLK
ncbi:MULTISPECIES: helix-turn-helix domain-containing protein [Leeuwenhoekiella]|uniref:helix-turn-helix domain-containing protein n=1 Tax=Leeuwenhoekiella TaxID=283735 RepID=UPI000C4913D3|nr:MULTISPECIES: helix-turn-helix domain-containing protein [Leeuwenhoekiella]MAO42212.1 DNA-binding protein [Leeuwenhoekiella sp.]MBQ51383.1 DNA-binding protein [Leeuwenhoekiella sp.]|tara:strand:+ start:116 stop:496 length:381 start_codon:yes stop_codon:yes gene_type:complete